MTEFVFRFSRYDKKAGRTRLSGRTSTHADDIDGALKVANAMLHGMRAADPDREYKVASVEHYRFTPSDGEGESFTTNVWETREEFSERAKREQA